MTQEEKLAAYDALIARIPGLERKGKKNVYTSMNGNMFSFLSPGGELAFRLSSDERTEFLARFPDAIVVQYGSVMKDYVEVPETLLQDEPALRKLFKRCVEHARTLRAKPTIRRPKKAE